MINSPLSVVRSLVPSIVGLRLLDIGSGDGGLAKMAVEAGAIVVGIDPNPEAVLKSKIQAPGTRFDIGTAEKLPYGDASFDIVVIVNTLHHVPVPAMELALLEAARVLDARGFLVVIEPSTNGSFFEALQLVEDETDVRMAAQLALKNVVSSGELRELRSISYVRRETFDNAERFLERIIAVDPTREKSVQSRLQEVLHAINKAAIKLTTGQLAFDQPIKADVFAKAWISPSGQTQK
jgi:ubiquinone/menaquinone biosynthesis C-methylase UbiE